MARPRPLRALRDVPRPSAVSFVRLSASGKSRRWQPWAGNLAVGFTSHPCQRRERQCTFAAAQELRERRLLRCVGMLHQVHKLRGGWQCTQLTVGRSQLLQHPAEPAESVVCRRAANRHERDGTGRGLSRPAIFPPNTNGPRRAGHFRIGSGQSEFGCGDRI